jgi:hypothetical protein
MAGGGGPLQAEISWSDLDERVEVITNSWALREAADLSGCPWVSQVRIWSGV